MENTAGDDHNANQTELSFLSMSFLCKHRLCEFDFVFTEFGFSLFMTIIQFQNMLYEKGCKT